MVVTAYPGNDLEEKARVAGTRHILLKPVDLPRLFTLVEMALEPNNRSRHGKVFRSTGKGMYWQGFWLLA